MPPGDRPKLLLSYCARNGLRPNSAHIAALDAPPGSAIESAEAAGVRLTLAELAGAHPPTSNNVFHTLYYTCPKRRWIIDNAARVETHCGATSVASVALAMREDSHKFLRAVGAKISLEEADALVGKRSWQFKDYAPLVAGLDLDGVRRFYQPKVVVPTHVCDTFRAAGLELTAEALAYACGADGSWNDRLIECVLAEGLAVDHRRALTECWPPRLIWRLYARDAHLPAVQAAFRGDYAAAGISADAARAIPRLPRWALLPPNHWARAWATEWLGYKRSVSVLQRAFRRALRSRAARKIQCAWRRASSDPGRGVGRRRLLRMFREAVEECA